MKPLVLIRCPHNIDGNACGRSVVKVGRNEGGQLQASGVVSMRGRGTTLLELSKASDGRWQLSGPTVRFVVTSSHCGNARSGPDRHGSVVLVASELAELALHAELGERVEAWGRPPNDDERRRSLPTLLPPGFEVRTP